MTRQRSHTTSLCASWLTVLFGALLCAGTAAAEEPGGRNGARNRGESAAHNGLSTAVIDLREWDFEEDRIATLDGRWEIYWQELLSPESFARMEQPAAPQPDGYFTMPGIWNEWPSPEDGVGGTGFATFRVRVNMPEDLTEGALRIQPASTAYRLWANGEIVAESGVPGRDRNSTTPHYRVVTGVFEAPEHAVELILQVSNFHHRRGGMWRPIELGTPELIESKDTLETAYDLLLIGSFAGLAFYNALVFRTSRRKRRAPLFLAFLFAVLALRIGVMGQMMVTRLIPGFPWTAQLRIEYLTAHFALLTLTLALHAIYPAVIDRRITLATVGLTVVNTISVLALPVLLYSRVVSYYVYAMIAMLAIELVVLIAAFARGRRGSWAGVIAVGLTFLITLGETIHYQQFILSRDFAPFGFLITLIAGDSVNQASAYLISAGANLVLVFLVANVLAVRGSRVLRILEGGRAAASPGQPHSPGDQPAEHAGLAISRPHAVAVATTEQNPEPSRKILTNQHGLTPRQAEIVTFVARGLSNKEIAAELFVSEATVKTHVYRIMRKAGTGNRTELSRWYYSLG